MFNLKNKQLLYLLLVLMFITFIVFFTKFNNLHLNSKLEPKSSNYRDSTPSPLKRNLSILRKEIKKGVPILVVSKTDKKIIKGATIYYSLDKSKSSKKIITNENGIGILPYPNKWYIEIYKKGFITKKQFINIPKKGTIVELVPYGKLEIFFHTENGKPLEGVKAWLIFPSQKQKIDYIKTSSKRGIISWENLIPGHNYRWQLLSKHYAQINPPYEKQEIEVTQKGIISKGFAPKNISGKILIKPGELKRIKVLVFSRCTVTGILYNNGLPFLNKPVVKLYKTKRIQKFRHPGIFTLDLEKQISGDSNGKFTFKGISPGPKVILANWENDKNSFFFAETSFYLTPGENKDLGTIEIKKGQKVEAVVNFRTYDGRLVKPTEIFGKPVGPIIELKLNSRTIPEKNDFGIHAAIFVKPGELFTLHGIPEGKFWFMPLLSSNAPELKQHFILKPKVKKVVFPISKKLEIPFIAEKLIEKTISVLPPTTKDISGTKLILHFFSKENDINYKFIIPGNSIKREYLTKVTLPESKYYLLGYVFPNLPNKKLPSNSNYYCYRRLVISQSNIKNIKINLQLGCAIKGCVRDSLGKPIKGITLQINGPWGKRKNGNWFTHTTKTDKNGNFKIYSLPPYQEILIESFSTEPYKVITPGPGEELFLELIKK